MEIPSMPEDVVAWVRKVFQECDFRISEKLAKVPQSSEPSLDMTFIECLTHYSSPRIMESGWSIRIDTHFLGGLRHWMRNWEIADIGILMHFQHRRKIVKSKAAVLQSKRLYPNKQQIHEDLPIDYEIGFARLSDPEESRVPLHHEAEFVFNRDSRYAALEAESDQVKAIDQYLQSSKVPVFYQFYNPPRLPFVQRFPLHEDGSSAGELQFGTRILPVNDVHSILKGKTKNYAPSVKDFAGQEKDFGWSLPHFVADLLLGCKLGYIYRNLGDETIFNLFNRRSGPIAAAIAVVIEAPSE